MHENLVYSFLEKEILIYISTSIKFTGGNTMNWTGIALLIQLFFGIVIGLYFWNLLKNQRTQKVSIDRDSRKEMDQLKKMRDHFFN